MGVWVIPPGGPTIQTNEILDMSMTNTNLRKHRLGEMIPQGDGHIVAVAKDGVGGD